MILSKNTHHQGVSTVVKWFFLVVLVAVALQPFSHARGVRGFDMPQLMSGSQLALVGKVISVEPSGLTTTLTYPTWKGSTFEWLKVEIQVVHSLKGTEKGAMVRTVLLSAPGVAPMLNPPGMIDVKVGQHLLMFLLPTTKKGVYASMSAPWDDDEAVFILDRKDGLKSLTSIYLMELIPKLVDERGTIIARGVEGLRNEYRKLLSVPAPKDAVIHLQWKTQTSRGGWQWDVPDDKNETAPKPIGPVTRQLNLNAELTRPSQEERVEEGEAPDAAQRP